ncbi:SGNH/GDSL hydrolase family protein [Cognatiluteimonas profundi]|uniref:SGNH/GDSL hydrolase family protein n=1 Tax=Cognatiluteimonas profundi TaxID=2594501 RepID=UPI001E333690|nr:SGNH/GDSL hydrolase family protein [Lysobacter profundi]
MTTSSRHASPPAHAAGTLSYLALGDSYTIGEGIDAADRWPTRLAARLRSDGIPLADPHVIATTGWTTDELQAAIAAQSPAPHDFVSLLVGVNNQYRGRSLQDYRRQFADLLGHAIWLAGGRADRVLVLAIPDWGLTPFGAASGRDRTLISSELQLYNTAARTICDGRGVAFVDIGTIYREHAAEPAMLADDGLHPSAAMHALWTDAALPVARRLLAHG